MGEALMVDLKPVDSWGTASMGDLVRVVAESCTVNFQLRHDWVCTANYAMACPRHLSDFELPMGVQEGLLTLHARRFELEGQNPEEEGSPPAGVEPYVESGTCEGRWWRYTIWVTDKAIVPPEANTLLLLGSGITALAGWAGWHLRRRRRG